MNIFLKIIHNEIIEIYTDEIMNNLIKVKAKNLEEFLNLVESYQYTEEIEDQVRELLEEEDVDPLSLFHIKHWVSNRSFGELIDMYENEEIIKPNMQREFVWNSLKCSRFIESIILGLPIPPLFLLEVSKNTYELIDGFQRLTTVYNFVKGKPWGGDIEGKKSLPSKLSSKVSRELQKKTFEQLDADHKRTIKRSTIPLIEFKQLEPDDLSCKYLIFERINTGSEKLNPMQIRKSLVYGKFIDKLYSSANKNEKFISLFSGSSIKRDVHIEAYLRTVVMTEVSYGQYIPNKFGINNLLNDYCENKKSTSIDERTVRKIDEAIDFGYKVFPDGELFRRVESKDGEVILTGNLNVNILEAFVGVYANESIDLDSNNVLENYKRVMLRTVNNVIDNDEENPFTTHTGARVNILKRYELMKEILGV